GPHSPYFLRGDEPGLLQDADVLLHAREGHVELLGKGRDRSVGSSELLQNAASGGIRKRGERVIQAGLRILNHPVQYITRRSAACKGRPSADSVFDRGSNAAQQGVSADERRGFFPTVPRAKASWGARGVISRRSQLNAVFDGPCFELTAAVSSPIDSGDLAKRSFGTWHAFALPAESQLFAALPTEPGVYA